MSTTVSLPPHTSPCWTHSLYSIVLTEIWKGFGIFGIGIKFTSVSHENRRVYRKRVKREMHWTSTEHGGEGSTERHDWVKMWGKSGKLPSRLIEHVFQFLPWLRTRHWCPSQPEIKRWICENAITKARITWVTCVSTHFLIALVNLNNIRPQPFRFATRCTQERGYTSLPNKNGHKVTAHTFIYTSTGVPDYVKLERKCSVAS
jgi:hypothetical protein